MMSTESHYSTVIPVPIEPASRLINDVLHWSKWCPQVVNCAVLENPVTVAGGSLPGGWGVGSIRRTRLQLEYGGIKNKVIREELIAATRDESKHRVELAFRCHQLPPELASAAASMALGKPTDVDSATRQRIEEDVFASSLPSTLSPTGDVTKIEIQKLLFPVCVSDIVWSLRASSITDSVLGTGTTGTTVSKSTGHRTFLEWHASIKIREPEEAMVQAALASKLLLEEGESVAPAIAVGKRLQARQLQLVEGFFNAYFSSMCNALWKVLMVDAFPIATSKIPLASRSEHEALEPRVLGLLVASNSNREGISALGLADLPQVVEQLLRSWESHAREKDALNMAILQLEAELAAAKKIAAAASNASPAPVAQQPSRPSSGAPSATPPPRKYPPSNGVIFVSSVTQTDPETAAEPPRPPFYSQILRDCIASGMLPGEDTLRSIFSELDATKVGYITDREVKQVLLTLNDFGTLEDKTGITEATEAAREDLQDEAFVQKTIATLQDLAANPTGATTTTTTTPPRPIRRNSSSNAILIPLSPRVRAQQLQERATDKINQRRGATFDVLARRWVDNHSRRERGKIFFEEFAVLLLQLCRQ